MSYDFSLTNNLGMEVGAVRFCEGIKELFAEINTRTIVIKKYMKDIGLPHVLRIYMRNQ